MMRIACFVALLAGTASADASIDSPEPAAKLDLNRLGNLWGAVFWSGPSPKFPHADCNLHYNDLEGYDGIEEGLTGVVVIAEPFDEKQGPALRAFARDSRQLSHQYVWDPEDRHPVESVAADLPIAITTDEAIRIYSGDRLVRTVPPGDASTSVTFSAGLWKVVGEHGATQLIYATPYLSHVSNGNCRFSWRLPAGRYRLRGWHPIAGERTRIVDLSLKKSRFTPLIFGNR